MSRADRVNRFTVSERAVHWLTALAFFSLLVSGLLVGRRGTFHDVMYAWHLASAGVLVGGVASIVVAGNRRALRPPRANWAICDARTARGSERYERACFPVRRNPRPARFNAGQKVNFTLVCIMLASCTSRGSTRSSPAPITT